MEYNDIYDENRNLTGRIHRRGDDWGPGEYGLVVCAWVYDGRGRILMTRRAPEKTFPGTWENSGGAAQAGETSRRAMVRELLEETGIHVREAELEYIRTAQDKYCFYDHYCLCHPAPLEEIVLQPGETDAVKWVTFQEVHDMIRREEICHIIAQQFLQEEDLLRARQIAQE